LAKDPAERLVDPVEIRRHPFLKALDWEQLEKKQVKPRNCGSSVDCELISFHIHLMAEVTVL